MPERNKFVQFYKLITVCSFYWPESLDSMFPVRRGGWVAWTSPRLATSVGSSPARSLFQSGRCQRCDETTFKDQPHSPRSVKQRRKSNKRNMWYHTLHRNITHNGQGSHCFTDKKIQIFSRTFQDPVRNFPGPFRSPQTLKYKEKTLASPPDTCPPSPSLLLKVGPFKSS